MRTLGNMGVGMRCMLAGLLVGLVCAPCLGQQDGSAKPAQTQAATGAQSRPGGEAATEPALTVDSPMVRRVVLAQLRPVTPQEIEHYRELIRTLAGEDVDKAKAACQEIIEHIERFYHIVRTNNDLVNRSIEQTIRNKDVSALTEAQHRLSGAMQLCRDENLLDDPQYLVRLLASCRDDKPNLTGLTDRLTALTGQKFGQDIGAWQKWSQQARAWGKLDQVRQQVGDLIALKSDGAKGVVLDRDRWAKLATAQMRNKLKDELKKNSHAPKDRLDEAVKEIDSISDAEVLFKTLQGVAGKNGTGTRTSDNMREVHFSGAMDGRLLTRGKLVRIELCERTGPRRRLDVTDDGEGRLRVMFFNPSEGVVAVLEQLPDKRIRAGDGERGYIGPSLTDLYAKHARWAQQRILGPLAAAGVDRRNLGVIPGASPGCLPPLAEAPNGVDTALSQKGRFQEVAEAIGGVISLGVGPKGLFLDRQSWQRQAQSSGVNLSSENDWPGAKPSFFDRWPAEPRAQAVAANLALFMLYKACQGADKSYRGGGGAGASGAGNWESDFSIHEMEASMEARAGVMDVKISEQKDPGRRLLVHDDGKGAARVVLSKGDMGPMLIIQQDAGRPAGGRFTVVHLDDWRFFVGSAPSLTEFVRKYPNYLAPTVLPCLNFQGVRTPAMKDTTAPKDSAKTQPAP